VNLAQAIDPERLDREQRPRKPSPLPALGIITHQANLIRTDLPLAPRHQPRRTRRPRP